MNELFFKKKYLKYKSKYFDLLAKGGGTKKKKKDGLTKEEMEYAKKMSKELNKIRIAKVKADKEQAENENAEKQEQERIAKEKADETMKAAADARIEAAAKRKQEKEDTDREIKELEDTIKKLEKYDKSVLTKYGLINLDLQDSNDLDDSEKLLKDDDSEDLEKLLKDDDSGEWEIYLEVDEESYNNLLKSMKDKLENKRKEFEDEYNPNSGKKDSNHTYIPIMTSIKISEELPKSLCPINAYDDKSELRKKFHIPFGLNDSDIENYYNYKSTLNLNESEIEEEKKYVFQRSKEIPFFNQLISNRDKKDYSRRSYTQVFNTN